MDNNFGSFGSDDDFGFGDDSSWGSESSTTSDSFGDSFDDAFADMDTSNEASNSDDNQFTDTVSNLDSQNQESNDDQGNLKKQSLIVIAVGIGLLIIVFIVAGLVRGHSNKNVSTNDVQKEQQNTVSNNENNQSANDILNDSNVSNDDTSNSNNNVITNTQDSKYTWTVITDSEDVQFNEEYSDMVFTITGIEHRARVVDTNNNLVVITNIQGSISGLPGTYELNVPYDKGVKLVVGRSFTVHVQLGTYNDKTVVGEIKY